MPTRRTSALIQRPPPTHPGPASSDRTLLPGPGDRDRRSTRRCRRERTQRQSPGVPEPGRARVGHRAIVRRDHRPLLLPLLPQLIRLRDLRPPACKARRGADLDHPTGLGRSRIAARSSTPSSTANEVQPNLIRIIGSKDVLQAAVTRSPAKGSARLFARDDRDGEGGILTRGLASTSGYRPFTPHRRHERSELLRDL